MKSKVALAVAIGLAIIAAVGIRAYLRRKDKEYRGSRRTVFVLSAKKRISRGTPLSPDMLDEKEVSQELVQDGRMILSKDHHRVARSKVLRTINPGEVLYWTDFGGRGTKADPGAGLPRGYRAIAIPVDKVTGCAGRLLPGSVVDVVVTRPLKKGSKKDTGTHVLLTKMPVLATDLNVDRPARRMTGKERRELSAYSTVTLRALPLEATLLAHVVGEGYQIHLIIRNPGDSAEQPKESVDIEPIDLTRLKEVLKAIEDRRKEKAAEAKKKKKPEESSE